MIAFPQNHPTPSCTVCYDESKRPAQVSNTNGMNSFMIGVTLTFPSHWTPTVFPSTSRPQAFSPERACRVNLYLYFPFLSRVRCLHKCISPWVLPDPLLGCPPGGTGGYFSSAAADCLRQYDRTRRAPKARACV